MPRMARHGLRWPRGEENGDSPENGEGVGNGRITSDNIYYVNLSGGDRFA